MKQLVQNLKDGKMELQEVAIPSVKDGQVLVKTYYSVISIGTEGKRVKEARMGYLAKAKARKDDVKKVIDTAKKIGVMETYKIVNDKLSAPAPLGYSSSGEVVAVGSGVKNLKVGDFVACAGVNAAHAEVVSVQENLCAKVQDKDFIKEASFATIGAIALQGVRVADVKLGEYVVVIGLGLLGQLTLELLKASGVQAIGVDLDPKKVELARKQGYKAFLRNDEFLESAVKNESKGYGVDSVIITAHAPSTDPVDLAGVLCRQKGKVVIVGNVPTGFSRKNYYRKELELKMSCSYGPGRYDSNYEEKGIDYPIGYVRWTENRNMESFVDLAASGRISLDHLITNVYDFDKAMDAYDELMNAGGLNIGVVFKYQSDKDISQKIEKKVSIKSEKGSISFIGAGSFAKNFLLPNLKGAKLAKVYTASGYNGNYLVDKYGFNETSDSVEDLLADKDSSCVFVVTRHNLHAPYVIQALEANKHVFVEKPLCLTVEELRTINNTAKQSKGSLTVGFNRRFAPAVELIKQSFEASLPKMIQINVNAGFVDTSHWTQDLEVGGGRILGEYCHFLDLAMFLADSKPVRLSSMSMNTSINDDCLSTVIHFDNDSVATVNYFANGSKELSKEQITVHSGGKSIFVDDYLTVNTFGKSEETKKFKKQDKGHAREMKLMIDLAENKRTELISYDELIWSNVMTFGVLKSIRESGNVIQLDRFLNESLS